MGSIEKRPLLRFLKEQETRNVCPGVEDEKLQKYVALLKPGNTYYRHVTYMSPVDHMSTIRSVSCRLLLDSNATAPCQPCEQVKPLFLKELRRAENPTDLKPKAPLSKVSKERIARALKLSRERERQLSAKVKVQGQTEFGECTREPRAL